MNTIYPLPTVVYMPLAEVEEPRDVALIYSDLAWRAVENKLRLKVVSRVEVREATVEHFDAMAAAMEGDVIYAVGGGLATDAAKYVAHKKGMPLVSVPTAATVDAFFTWATGVRRDGCVYYLEVAPPDELIVDLEVLASAPLHLRSSGLCDVLSIATGCADWEYAHAIGKNPTHAPYDAAVARMARSILDAMLEAAESAGAAQPEGLRRTLDCLAMEVQLCNQVGHARCEEGSEHYFAYAVENVLGKGLPHGDLVGPGIIQAGRLQGIDVAPLEKALRQCHVPLDRIPEEVSRKVWLELPAYCVKHNLAHGVAHDMDATKLDKVPLTI